MQTFLHVGCGNVKKSQISGFKESNWNEIRFDIDKNVRPDIEGTLTDMSKVKSRSVDAIYSSHNIEHVNAHEVPIVLKEFYRVLSDDGIVVAICPDLQSVSEAILDDKLFDPLYVSPEGPISPIDIIYGHRDAIEKGNAYMSHKCGFTYSVLDKFFSEAGFEIRYGGRRKEQWDLFIVAFKQKKTEEEVKIIAAPFI
jgi:predicted SAM-dependent methyltransferase